MSLMHPAGQDFLSAGPHGPIRKVVQSKTKMSSPKASTCQHLSAFMSVAFTHLWFNDITLYYYDFLNPDLVLNATF